MELPRSIVDRLRLMMYGSKKLDGEAMERVADVIAQALQPPPGGLTWDPQRRALQQSLSQALLAFPEIEKLDWDHKAVTKMQDLVYSHNWYQ